MKFRRGYIVERYGDYGWCNAVILDDVREDEVIFRSEETARHYMRMFKNDPDRDHFDYRITTTVQLH